MTTNDVTPSALADRLRMSMIRLARQSRRRDTAELTITQLSALATVVRDGPLGIGQLADIEVLPSPAATRLADKLEEAGLIERRSNPADRRGVLVTATDIGQQLYASRQESGNAWLSRRIGVLSDTDRRTLERAITVLERLSVDEPEGDQTAGESRQIEEVQS